MNTRMQKGFGLIELLISILIGLIVVAGISSLVVATLRANTENLQMTRLTQEMRAVMQLVTGDLRRAGYDKNAIYDFGTADQAFNQFTEVRVFDASGTEITLTAVGIDPSNPAPCVLYSYDFNGDGVDQSSEYRGFKFDSAAGSIVAKVSGSATDANCSDGEWETLTDEQTVEVQQFGFSTVGGKKLQFLPDESNNPILTVRALVVTVDAGLANDASVQRTMRETVRVRNDLLN